METPANSPHCRARRSREFGTTAFGGSDAIFMGGGTIFKLDGTSFHQIFRFCAAAQCTDGQRPAAAMIPDPAGTLYGVTLSGGMGAFGGGTLFKLKP